MKGVKGFEGKKSYIQGSYVKYMESFGMRVVPIIQEESEKETLDKLEKLDGILFPGGTGGYKDKAEFVFNEVLKKNQNGQFYPMWGICEGFEYLASFTAKEGWDVLDTSGEFSAHASLPLSFKMNPNESALYGLLGDRAEALTEHDYTYNAHNLGLDVEKMKSDSGLKDFWKLTASSVSPTTDKEFVASMESAEFPILATQFHPEKPSQLWVDNRPINHSWESIEL